MIKHITVYKVQIVKWTGQCVLQDYAAGLEKALPLVKAVLRLTVAKQVHHQPCRLIVVLLFTMELVSIQQAVIN